MATPLEMSGSGGLVAAVVPGDGRLRFCRSHVADLQVGDWVAIDGPFGFEPGQIRCGAGRVASVAPIAPSFSVDRRLTRDEIRRVGSYAERAVSLARDAQRAINNSELNAAVASLRFSLDGSTILCHCCGVAAEIPPALEGVLEAALDLPVRVEWSVVPLVACGGRGRFGETQPVNNETIRARLRIDFTASDPALHGWPRLDACVRTPQGLGRLVSVSVRHETAHVRLDSGEMIDVPLGEAEVVGDGSPGQP